MEPLSKGSEEKLPTPGRYAPHPAPAKNSYPVGSWFALDLTLPWLISLLQIVTMATIFAIYFSPVQIEHRARLMATPL